MPILIKLVAAVLLGIVMIFSLMLLIIAGAAFIQFIAHMLGLNVLAEGAYSVQKGTWLKTKKWFFRYKDINEEKDK